MKTVIVIKKTLSIILLGAILLGSSGITVIEHDCKSCGVVSVKAESLLTVFTETDNCCEEPVIAHHSKSNQNLCGGCCEFKIEQFVITGFVPPAEYQPQTAIPVSFPAGLFLTHLQITSSLSFRTPEKYGGLPIFTLNCQLRA